MLIQVELRTFWRGALSCIQGPKEGEIGEQAVQRAVTGMGELPSIPPLDFSH